jgi:ADP-heptose:LPS heptosyltransferase
MKPFPPELEASLARSGEDLSIAVVRLGAMGDIVRVLPAVRLLRFHLPDARIHWICDDRWAPLLEGHRDLDSVVAIPRSRWRRERRRPSGWPAVVRGVLHARRLLRDLDCGLALDFHGNLRSGIVARSTRARVRLGHAAHQQKEGNRFLTTHRVEPGPERRRSRVERHLALVRALGVVDDVLPDAGFRPTSHERAAAREALRSAGATEDRPYAILNPGASAAQAYKQPPPSLLAAAARPLSARGIAPIVIHGPGEEPAARAVAGESNGEARIAPPTALRVLVPLLAGARLLVGGDSGPLHLACGVRCPVVGLYGPTDPVVNSPWNVRHRVVAPRGRRYTGIKRIDRAAGGFDGIRPDEVARAVEEILDERD